MNRKIKIGFILFFVLFSNSVLSQRLEFLNSYFYTVYDTTKYDYSYFNVIQENNNSIVSQTFNLDSVRVRRQIILFDSLRNKISKSIYEYFESEKLKSKEVIDYQKNTKEKKEFFETGSLKTDFQELNEIVVLEKFFSESGEEIQKPILLDAEPQGGKEGWNNYLSKSLLYPRDARIAGYEGTVILIFVVDEKGDIIDPEVANPEEVDKSLSEEALRMIKKYPYKWTPSYLDGKIVKSKMRIPIAFKLT